MAILTHLLAACVGAIALAVYLSLCSVGDERPSRGDIRWDV